jgi:murein DD-endopeptidase MepM/ murein hydrolase activator NlpD
MKIYQRILLIVSVILIWDSASFFMSIYNEQIALRELRILTLELKLTNNEILYKDSVINMVEDIYRNDSFLNVGGSSDILEYDIASFILAMENDVYELNLFLKEAENFFDNRMAYFGEIPDIWPVTENPLNKISSPFGPRFDPFTLKQIGDHRGIDIKAPFGEPVLATADGKVNDHWIYDKEFGRCVLLVHEHGFKTFYGHMSKVIVHEGDFVKKGQPIGYIGSTGSSTGPHIHYEIIKNGIKVDPINYMRRTM